MAGNPLIDQGTLNRLRGSVVVSNYPALNVTAPFLGREGISMTTEGEATTFLPTMTGAAISPEPYQMVRVSIQLLRTQNLSQQWESQRVSNSAIGNITIFPDSAALSQYLFNNCAIENVELLRFNGQDAGYMVMLRGYYLINNSLWGF